jgi:ABC-2 type transport system permease protein
MIRALLLRTINDGWLLLVALCAAMFLFPWVFIWAQNKISIGAFSEFLTHALPQDFQKVWGVPISEVASSAGRVALLYVHPLVILSALVWAISRGSDCVSGEIGRGSMEMLLAQPVRRVSIFATHAIVTIFGSALLAATVWCGTAAGVHATSLHREVAATRYLPAAVNLFSLMVCIGGLSALASSWDNQRWRTVGLMGTLYVVSAVLAIASRISDRWQWLKYGSVLSAYNPQTSVAQPEAAWSLLAHRDGHVTSLGLGGCQLLLIAIGLAAYATGAIIFARREIPAPI